MEKINSDFLKEVFCPCESYYGLNAVWHCVFHGWMRSGPEGAIPDPDKGEGGMRILDKNDE